jgi:uncharacterized repeat protein (TIGR03803 family)
LPLFLLGLGAVVAGCSQQDVSSMPTTATSASSARWERSATTAPHSSSAFKVLYSFNGSSGGAWPLAGLVGRNGAFYGTTSGGKAGNGTIFAASASGFKGLLYTFKGTPDGSDPAAGLTIVGGTMYGTTLRGGTYNKGTVFEVIPYGKSAFERVVHSFKGGKDDGAFPAGGLVAVGGALYGTTTVGGTQNFGTVFKISVAGSEQIVYSFQGTNSRDGANPAGGLFYDSSSKLLIGTTAFGGLVSISCARGCGTVFSLTLTGFERVAHAFFGEEGNDGAYPSGALIYDNGLLLGTTENGGGGLCSGGCGTVFAVNSGGGVQAFRLSGGAGGANPQGGVIDVGGTLYGTTYHGGSSNCKQGCGTIFQFDVATRDFATYALSGGAGGAYPVGSMVYDPTQNVLLGTTFAGGAGTCISGCGTVFSLQLSPFSPTTAAFPAP